MALNAASHNPTGTRTGSPSGPPPPVSSGLADILKKSSENDAIGNNVGGKDQQNNDVGQTVIGEAGKMKTADEKVADDIVEDIK